MNDHNTFAIGPLTQIFWIIFQQNCYLFIIYTDLPPGLKFWGRKHKKTEKMFIFETKIVNLESNFSFLYKIKPFFQRKLLFWIKIDVFEQEIFTKIVITFDPVDGFWCYLY